MTSQILNKEIYVHNFFSSYKLERIRPRIDSRTKYTLRLLVCGHNDSASQCTPLKINACFDHERPSCNSFVSHGKVWRGVQYLSHLSGSITAGVSTLRFRSKCAASGDVVAPFDVLGGFENSSTLEEAEEIPHHLSSSENVDDEEEIGQAALIWRAVKLPIYTVAFIPLMVGAGAAHYETGVFYATRFWQFLLFSILVIGWLNLSNDAYDAETGVDKGKKESVVNMTGSRLGVLVASYACLVCGLAGIFWGAQTVGDPRVGMLLAGAVACGYIYQCPPFRWSYKGVGELLCFYAFGPLATAAFYLHQASWQVVRAPLTPAVMSASVLVGITTSLILFCSHFHQIEGDLAVGKISPLVRMGTSQGAYLFKAAVTALYILTAVFVLSGALPPSCAITALVTIPIGRMAAEFVINNHSDKSKIFTAKYFCVRLHVVFGLALALGLRLGHWWPA